MSNLQLFVIKTFGEDSNAIKTLESFKGRADKFILVDSYFEINSIDKDEDGWFGVFYDNEIIDERLAESLEEFFELSEASVLVCFKKGKDGQSKCPRFFRGDVELKLECLAPILESKLVHQAILNGWVLDVN